MGCAAAAVLLLKQQQKSVKNKTKKSKRSRDLSAVVLNNGVHRGLEFTFSLLFRDFIYSAADICANASTSPSPVATRIHGANCVISGLLLFTLYVLFDCMNTALWFVQVISFQFIRKLN